MPIKYILPIIDSDHRKGNPIKVLTSMVSKLEKLQENRLQSKVKLRTHQWNGALWSQQKNIKKSSNSMILFYSFQRGVSHILESSLGNGLNCIK
jgi:hypothetical protein